MKRVKRNNKERQTSTLDNSQKKTDLLCLIVYEITPR